jgi:hypothetical protein
MWRAGDSHLRTFRVGAYSQEIGSKSQDVIVCAILLGRGGSLAQ